MEVNCAQHFPGGDNRYRGISSQPHFGSLIRSLWFLWVALLWVDRICCVLFFFTIRYSHFSQPFKTADLRLSLRPAFVSLLKVCSAVSVYQCCYRDFIINAVNLLWLCPCSSPPGLWAFRELWSSLRHRVGQEAPHHHLPTCQASGVSGEITHTHALFFSIHPSCSPRAVRRRTFHGSRLLRLKTNWFSVNKHEHRYSFVSPL